MLEHVIEVVGTILGVWLLGTIAWLGLSMWAVWTNPDFQTTKIQKSKTYITIGICGLIIYFIFFI